jgi:hypothetical protein
MVGKTEILKKSSSSVKEKGQYAVAFSLIGVMLYAAGFPIFFLLFIGALGYFIWKIFSSEARNDVRRIFEFYIAANEILREDQRRWYGFEIQETISNGEKIVRSMSYSPPLVHFALGALYAKLGDNSSAIKHLSYIENGSTEAGIVFPSSEFRDYVRVLRKIERFPAEAPQTSSAIRTLERARKNKLTSLLEGCRSLLNEEQTLDEPEQQRVLESVVEKQERRNGRLSNVAMEAANQAKVPVRDDEELSSGGPESEPESSSKSDHHSNRKTISEVLHDIYDERVQ